MSDFKQKDNSGALFKNEKKQSETHADYQGKVLIGGIEYYINAWVKESKAGQKYFSLSFNPVQKKSRVAEPERSAHYDEPELPF